jgi:DNA polymerase elongation subunit (family B)
LPQDLIDKATKKDIKNAINEAKKQLSSVKDESKVLEIKEKIRSLENYLNEAKGPINKSSNFRSKRLENCRTNVRKRIKKALDNIEREIPYMKDYLNDKTIKTGSKCNYEQDGSKPAKWILDPPKLN